MHTRALTFRKRDRRKRGRGAAVAARDKPISPMSPSKVAALRKGKKYKLMDTGDKCTVWDEDSAGNKRRREHCCCCCCMIFVSGVSSGVGVGLMLVDVLGLVRHFDGR